MIQFIFIIIVIIYGFHFLCLIFPISKITITDLLILIIQKLMEVFKLQIYLAIMIIKNHLYLMINSYFFLINMNVKIMIIVN